jgi:hypothetical protein
MTIIYIYIFEKIYRISISILLMAFHTIAGIDNTKNIL